MDKNKLKELALSAQANDFALGTSLTPEFLAFTDEATPAAILELLAENDRLVMPVAPDVGGLMDEKWTLSEQAAFSAWAITEFPNECNQGMISLGSAWKQGQAYATKAMASDDGEPVADLAHFINSSIRDFPDFREDVERLSSPGLDKKQAKIIRKDIYDTIDQRVRNAVKATRSVHAAEAAPPAPGTINPSTLATLADNLIREPVEGSAEFINGRVQGIRRLQAEIVAVAGAQQSSTSEQAHVLPPTRGTDSQRETLYMAALNCGHSITDERIILHRNPKLPGCALSQLADRLAAPVPPVPAPADQTQALMPHSECAQGRCGSLPAGCRGECDIRRAFGLNNVACGDPINSQVHPASALPSSPARGSEQADERALFEAWLGRPMMNPEHPTHYNGRDVRTAWGAWQAARVLTQQAAPEAPAISSEDIRVARHAVFNLKEYRAGRTTFPGEALDILERALDRMAPASEQQATAVHPIIQRQVERLREKWPQAHAQTGEHGEHLIVIPSVTLPEGWSATICTLLFVAPTGFPGAAPENFWVDAPGLEFNGEKHRWSCATNSIPAFPCWQNMTRFKWHLQAWNPNRDTLWTVAHAIIRSMEGQKNG